MKLWNKNHYQKLKKQAQFFILIINLVYNYLYLLFNSVNYCTNFTYLYEIQNKLF